MQRLLPDDIGARWRLELKISRAKRRVDLELAEGHDRLLAETVQNFQHGELGAFLAFVFSGLEAHADALQLSFFGLGRGLHPLQTGFFGQGRQREVGLQALEVGCRRDDSSRRAVEHLREFARRDLVQVHVVKPQRLPIGHDALLEGFLVNKLETVGPEEFKAAGRRFDLGRLPVFGRTGHDLGKAGTPAFGCPDEILKAI